MNGGQTRQVGSLGAKEGRICRDIVLSWLAVVSWLIFPRSQVKRKDGVANWQCPTAWRAGHDGELDCKSANCSGVRFRNLCILRSMKRWLWR